ncbi:hypothetical protein PEC311524_07000 [Pectobacterium carotovorum subsp. carotovorum]|nr:hypothetical protein PEC311524_07000 [Pectobacterium carotovorum subsp. carotovorum]
MKNDESNNTHHQVMSMYVIDIYVNCPRCGERQDGFVGNPAGASFKCDDCGEFYSINKDANVSFR